MGTKIADQLAEMLSILTEDNWVRGSYFSVRDGHVCMCAHGLAQSVSNERVKEALGTDARLARRLEAAAEAAEAAEAVTAAGAASEAAVTAAKAAEAAVTAGAARSAGEAAEAARGSAEMVEASWEARPYWVMDSSVENSYVMGMVGLTANFNDNHTYAEVRAKLEEAHNLAKELGI